MEKIFANKATEKELIPKYTSSACSTLPEKKKPTNQPNKQKKKTQQNKQKEKKTRTNILVKKWPKELNRHLFNEEIQKANKHMKICSQSLKYSVQFIHSVVSDSLLPHEPQQARPPCPSTTPKVHPNPCSLSW